MSHIARVNIVSGNRAGRIVGKRDSALEGTCPSSRNIERGDSAIQGTHETVIDVARVHVLSRDRPAEPRLQPSAGFKIFFQRSD